LGAAAGALLGAPRARASLADKPLIMIDPGHGGEDPGATAPDGAQEKWITLYTARALSKALRQTRRYRVAMTRDSDVYIPLPDRVADAVSAGAGLFLSLHCDHLPTPDMRGASVFTLSDTASDALAGSVAADENATVSPPGSPIPSASPQVASILASLETRATKIGSVSLARDLAQSLQGAVPLLPGPQRAANFAVLRDPSTPAALLEMGCLTNTLDELRLRSPKQRAIMVQRIAAAIDIYFANYARQRLAG
jgi:N-acetylmuramoyl-L-alanine amidase